MSKQHNIRGSRRKRVLAKHPMFMGGYLAIGRKHLFKAIMGKTTRVIVYGQKGVGKTAILEQLIYGNVSKTTEFQPTIEDIYAAHVETDRGTREKVRFYDTEGLGIRSQARQVVGQADGYILVYDPFNPDSLDTIISLKKDIDRNRDKKEVTVIVLGNRTKVSDTGSLENTASKASQWASREKLRHYEVNAMDRTSLYEPFVHLTSKMNPPPNKSSFPQLSMVRKTIGRPDNS